jgi:hypothetical protein
MNLFTGLTLSCEVSVSALTLTLSGKGIACLIAGSDFTVSGNRRVGTVSDADIYAGNPV